MKNKNVIEEVTINPVESAKEAGLRYTHDASPGIIRKKAGKGFYYLDQKGEKVLDKEIIERINLLRIPPAWKNVWICKYSHGHLQATGIDARGRKQYRYHQKWREARDETKYHRMIAFAKVLPLIRKRTEEDLLLKGLPKDKVLATIVKLLEKTLIRVGNEEYAKENDSYGLTTMRDKHVDIEQKKVYFEFKGKSGVKHSIELEDPQLAKIVKKCKELPGYELFQYIDENGARQDVTSSDVNEYLFSITGEHFTAKDFRTWHGTILAANALQEFQEFASETQAKKNIVKVVEAVSKQLGNTKAVCRKCYIHPAVIESYLKGSFFEQLQATIEAEGNADVALKDLRPEEASIVLFLENSN